MGGAVQTSRFLIVTVLSWLIHGVISGSHHDRRASEGIRLRIHKYNNGTFFATVLGGKAIGNLSDLSELFSKDRKDSDPAGAVYYVVAVILMYGFSIILMIGSLIRKNKQDQQAHCYLKDISKVRRMEKKQETLKTRDAMRYMNAGHIIGDKSPIVDANSDGIALKGIGEKNSGSIINTTSVTSAMSACGSGWSVGNCGEGEEAGALPLILSSAGSVPSSPTSSHVTLPSGAQRQLTHEVQVPAVQPIVTLDIMREQDGNTIDTKDKSGKILCERSLPHIVVTSVVPEDDERENISARSSLLEPLPEVDEDTQIV